jgi:hypothetical protein
MRLAMTTGGERLNDVKIKLGAGSGSVQVDGHEVADSVISLAVDGRAGEPAMVRLNLRAGKTVTIDAEARVRIDHDTRAVLLALGWTPPPWDR